MKLEKKLDGFFRQLVSQIGSKTRPRYSAAHSELWFSAQQIEERSAFDF